MTEVQFQKRARPTSKLADTVAARIEREIIDMGWPVGKVLGSETDLINKHGVSRAVFREAVRLLEADMIARMKPGPNGGLIVVAPQSEGMAHAMALFLTYEGVSVRQLLEVRSLIEGQAAALAAVFGSDQDHATLSELLADEENCVEHDWQSAKNFHVRVAQMSKNPAVFLIARSLIMLTEQQTTPLATRSRAANKVHKTHLRIGEAILQRDAEKARRRMSQHIAALDPWLGEANLARNSSADSA